MPDGVQSPLWSPHPSPMDTSLVCCSALASLSFMQGLWAF